MSANDDRPVVGLSDVVRVLFEHPTSIGDAMREEIFDLEQQVFVLRVLGARVDFKAGRYCIPSSEENLECLIRILESLGVRDGC